MEEVERPDLPSQAWYVKEWNEDRGESQPVPFAKGYKFSFAPEDELYNISISSETGELELFDGRPRSERLVCAQQSITAKSRWSQNGISVQEKRIGYVNQYSIQPGRLCTFQEKFAVIELDKYDNDYPTTASLLHVNADGSKDVVYSAAVTEPISWQRYKYVNFDLQKSMKQVCTLFNMVIRKQNIPDCKRCL